MDVTLITTGSNNNATLVNTAATTTLGPVSVNGNLAVIATKNLALSSNVTTTGTTTLNFGSTANSTFTTALGVALAASSITVNGGAFNNSFNIFMHQFQFSKIRC